MDLSRFGAAPPWSLGIEEELMLVDAETFEPARDGFSRVFGEATERIKPELFESFVEITTTVVETPEEAESELRALRGEVAERAAAHGLALLATGSHPTARGRVPIVPVERYRRLKAKLGAGLYRQRVCGLHVHVAVPDPATCLRAYEGVVPRLPSLLAASANSPFWEGAESGRRSIRSEILLEMPTGGTPPVLRSWNDWQTATRGDSTRRHWDAWPRPSGKTTKKLGSQPRPLHLAQARDPRGDRHALDVPDDLVAEPHPQLAGQVGLHRHGRRPRAPLPLAGAPPAWTTCSEAATASR